MVAIGRRGLVLLHYPKARETGSNPVLTAKKNKIMTYYSTPAISPYLTGKVLKRASNIIKSEFPNGPTVRETVKPDKDYTFNEIANNIPVQLLEISKSLH